ncbi:MAG TPA: PilZ domain-containing protein [Kofleriaceae bacterium]|nr:PilZ domain-containing protein [Kofleriaceae bacterium]
MTERQAERRRHERIAVKGTLIVHGQDQNQRGRIANISLGGVYVVTKVALPDRMLARTIEFELRLDAGHAEWTRAAGRVSRLRPNGIAIAFDDIPPTLRKVILDISSSAHARARILSVVLVDADQPRRNAMADGFRSAGCHVIEASQPLEAIVRLGESSFEPDVVAVADSRPTGAAEDMRKFVAAYHPSARLITIGDEPLQPDGLAHWLSSLNPDDDLARRVRAALIGPKSRGGAGD